MSFSAKSIVALVSWIMVKTSATPIWGMLDFDHDWFYAVDAAEVGVEFGGGLRGVSSIFRDAVKDYLGH